MSFQPLPGKVAALAPKAPHQAPALAPKPPAPKARDPDVVLELLWRGAIPANLGRPDGCADAAGVFHGEVPWTPPEAPRKMLSNAKDFTLQITPAGHQLDPQECRCL